MFSVIDITSKSTLIRCGSPGHIFMLNRSVLKLFTLYTWNHITVWKQIILILIYKYVRIGLVGRVFVNGSGDRDLIPGRVIPKILKMVLDTYLLKTQQYKVRIKGKVEQSRKGLAPFPTPQYSSYWKGSLMVALDYGRLLTFIYIYIYIYMCVCVCVCVWIIFQWVNISTIFSMQLLIDGN